MKSKLWDVAYKNGFDLYAPPTDLVVDRLVPAATMLIEVSGMQTTL